MNPLTVHTRRFLQSLRVQFLITRRYRAHFKRLHSGDIVLDCGAHVGDISRQFAKTGATVYAFEPNPHAYTVLVHRLRHYRHVHCLPMGVWYTNTTLPLFLHRHHYQDPVKWASGSSLVPEKANIDRATSTPVKVIDLAAFILNLPRRVTLLKLDVEGAEYDILTHLIATRAINRVESTLVEVHERKNPLLREKAQALRQLIAHQDLKHIDLSWH